MEHDAWMYEVKNKRMEDFATIYRKNAPLRGKHRKVRFDSVYDMDNLILADKKARKRKSSRRSIRRFDSNREERLKDIQEGLINQTYHTSKGRDIERLCPCGKVRRLHTVPYDPDHIVHHAHMQVVLPVLNIYYYYDSCASVEEKGIHFAAKRAEKWIDKHKSAGRLYSCKLDYVKFYQNIVQEYCYNSLCNIFGDKGIRYLFREIIFACEQGLGIGLYPIQPIANAYTSYMLRLVMSKFNVFVMAYCDDIVILSESKKEVWKAVNFIIEYSSSVMRQPLHDNIGVQIIDETHFLDYVGYRFYFNHTFIRKKLKKRFKKKMARLKNEERRYRVATSYKGWLMHCNGFNLWRSIMNMKSFKDLEVPKFEKVDRNGKRIIDGTKATMSMLTEQPLEFLDVELGVKSKFDKPAAVVQVRNEQGKLFKFFTSSPRMLQIFQHVSNHDMLPFKGRIINKNTAGYPDYDLTD